MNPIIELLDTCEIDVRADSTSYKPLGSPPDRYVHSMLDISQGGAYHFHRALQRPGKACMKGDA